MSKMRLMISYTDGKHELQDYHVSVSKYTKILENLKSLEYM